MQRVRVAAKRLKLSDCMGVFRAWWNVGRKKLAEGSHCWIEFPKPAVAGQQWHPAV